MKKISVRKGKWLGKRGWVQFHGECLSTLHIFMSYLAILFTYERVDFPVLH